MNFPFSPYSKETQLNSKRVKPTQRQLGAISPKVREMVKQRSKGACELCRKSQAVHMAHLVGRKQLKTKTTSDILLHVCVPCHKYLDETLEGIAYKKRLMEEAK